MTAADFFRTWLAAIVAESLTRFDDALRDPTEPPLIVQHPKETP